MKVINQTVQAHGSALVYSYDFDNGYSANWSKSKSPFGGDIFFVYTKKGNFASQVQAQKAKQAIDEYNS
jgi:hypothetical protein